ncbi:hypothetical protein V2G26_015777 [Clonostachys chloroleuca]
MSSKQRLARQATPGDRIRRETEYQKPENKLRSGFVHRETPFGCQDSLRKAAREGLSRPHDIAHWGDNEPRPCGSVSRWSGQASWRTQLCPSRESNVSFAWIGSATYSETTDSTASTCTGLKAPCSETSEQYRPESTLAQR